MIKLTIDNREVEVPKGTTILKAAQGMGIDIPTEQILSDSGSSSIP